MCVCVNKCVLMCVSVSERESTYMYVCVCVCEQVCMSECVVLFDVQERNKLQ